MVLGSTAVSPRPQPLGLGTSDEVPNRGMWCSHRPQLTIRAATSRRLREGPSGSVHGRRHRERAAGICAERAVRSVVYTSIIAGPDCAAGSSASVTPSAADEGGDNGRTSSASLNVRCRKDLVERNRYGAALAGAVGAELEPGERAARSE